MQQKHAAYSVKATEVLEASKGSAKWNSLILDPRETRPENVFVFQVGRTVETRGDI